jgi:D-xylose transport system permease protein
MTGIADSTSDRATGASPRPSVRRMLAATEVDVRLLGMLAALVVILLSFHVLSNGKFINPANMVTLAVQATGTAIMATGMVLIIVSRNIDLSVGSQVGVTAMVYAVLMTDILPDVLGIPVGAPYMWIVALALGIALGAFIGAFQGFIIAYVGVPSFVVTLGGLLALRGTVWVLSEGASVTGIDNTFRQIGGGVPGSLGGEVTWVLAILGCIGIVGYVIYNRRQRVRFGFPLRPMWAEILIIILGCGILLALAAFANENVYPKGVATRIAEARGVEEPPGGLRVPMGISWPIILLVGVGIVMTFIATRRRFGRYVYAYGGNPEAADLAGINTRWTIMKTFIVMGVLCALAGAIVVGRLNGAAQDLGSGDELYVIAAAVVGGTSFAGGIGTIPGAILGAIVMAALAYGLAFMGVPSPIQSIVAGIVLVVAVGFDTYNRRRGSTQRVR